ncbi:ester cyclase [Larkinella bovis]|uniref:Ester cyclase n=1 Tax=Larkinella bovis TaxID=683041 RepID=A0ABW0I3I8_9BACT
MRHIQSTVLYRWFNDVWNQDDENAIDRLLAADARAYGILREDQPRGPEGFKGFFREFRSQFHGIHVEVEDVISQDGVESARMTVTATHTETGKQVIFPGISMAYIQDGKIAQAWNSYDFLSMYQQLGQTLTPVP